MKSMSRGCAEPAAVTRTMLSPQRMTTEPPACLAHLPVSIVISLPPTMPVSRTNPMYLSFSKWTSLGASIERPEPSIQSSNFEDSTERSNLRDPCYLRRYLVVSVGVIAYAPPKAKTCERAGLREIHVLASQTAMKT